jgi:multidrug efflux pump subunit AcrA (membrane-fusion protein)
MVQKQQARDEARAAIEQAKATLTAAQLDLSYTHIYRADRRAHRRNFVDVGNLVGAEERRCSPASCASIRSTHTSR